MMFFEIISGVTAIVISVISLALTLAQNRKLHMENVRLQVIPSINLELIVQEKILGHSEKRNQGTLDEITSFVTQYTDLYINQSLILGDREKSKEKFTLVITNDGNGLAKDIKIKKVVIRTDNSEMSYDKNDIFFSCNASDKKAIKIFSDQLLNNLTKIEINISYNDILGKIYTNFYSFIPSKNSSPEMKREPHPPMEERQKK